MFAIAHYASLIFWWAHKRFETYPIPKLIAVAAFGGVAQIAGPTWLLVIVALIQLPFVLAAMFEMWERQRGWDAKVQQVKQHDNLRPRRKFLGFWY